MDCAMPADRGLRCVLMGDQSLLSACGDVLIRRGHEIRAVVTENASVAAWASDRAIAVSAPGDGLAGWLKDHDHDWFFSIANLRALPDAVWRQAQRGAINFHDGPLPRYAGLNAPVWAILNGETTFGVTWHEITCDIDAGDIYVQRQFDIAPDETAFTLNSKCFEAAIASFETLADALGAGVPVTRPQDLGARTLFARHARPDAAGLLRLDRSAAELDRLVRALDFGPGYRNPLVAAKLLVGDEALPVSAIEKLVTVPIGPAGLVLDVGDDTISVVAGDGAVRLRTSRANREPLRGLVAVGNRLKVLSAEEASAAREAAEAAARGEPAVRRRLETLDPLAPPSVRESARTEAVETISIAAPAMDGSRLLAGLLAVFARDCGKFAFDLAYADSGVRERAEAFPALFSAAVPLRVAAAADTTVAAFSEQIHEEIQSLAKRGGWPKDLVLREPGLRAPQWPVGLACAEKPSTADAIAGCAITLVAPTNGGDALMLYDPAQLPAADAAAMAGRAETVLQAFAQDPNRSLGDLPLMSPEAERQLLATWSRRGDAYDQSVCMHQAVERQARLTPDLVALTCGAKSLTFQELEARAGKVAQALLQRGVGRDEIVGLHMSRSVDLVVGALGIQKAGGAYLPLDPAYPADRLAFMVEDSGARVILTERALAETASWNAAVVAIEDVVSRDAVGDRSAVEVAPDALAYVIYTSGSTGRPKGVMIEHRNVANFFAGMDERIPVEGEGRPVWLAVTSLSFDISVLELFWTLSRGFHVVMAEPPSAEAQRQGEPADVAGIEFGLFYWGTDDGAGRQKYRLLLEGAKFADTHGFTAVWTPERHFHDFGDPYPNPAVTGAAVAAVTKNVSIRAGSCVLPLHHPARVAEEWAVVDNLSDGRVGLAFASGWMPEDFVLRPENAPPNNKMAMLRDIEQVRRHWRGEKTAYRLSGDTSVEVVTHPRPVQQELPVWITTAGNPDTYREAAAHGANVLTHLLGQSIEELADKIRIYRSALAEAGRNPAAGKVTLMLHTLVGDDREQVREITREPMKGYLRSAAALIKQYAWAFPAFKKPIGAKSAMDIDLRSLSAEEMDAILDFAFERYFKDSGLFGTLDDALERVAQLKAIGVDEIACLIDFGVDSNVVLKQLAQLAEVVAAARRETSADASDYGIAAQIGRHRVTHLQCTPSMAGMLLDDPETRAALGSVRRLFIGGEALTGALLSELASVTAAPVENMYGPTETTIWSSTGSAKPGVAVAPLGAPIANTQLYVLDGGGRLCPPLCPGELHIAGDGVARGYLHRPELTAERFVADPFAPGARMYRTGDLVTLTETGDLRYLGRADGQVKLRGRRIELGEIEARLRELPDVREAVALVREDRPGDARLVAYVQPNGPAPSEADLRAHLGSGLPDYMVPAHFVTVDVFPQTPNAKIDRKALPRPDEARPAAPDQSFAPASDPVQKQVADVFQRILGVERVGLDDNFFALGGHSLLAVQAHRELKASVAPDLRITDLFRFPTVAELAKRISGSSDGSEDLRAVSDRAALRRRALTGRPGLPGLAREAAS